MKLFYIILGATPPGRNIEQHDVFFGIAEKIADLIPDMKAFWPEAKGKIHIDCYQEVEMVDGYRIKIVPRTAAQQAPNLFFINLGGYAPGQFTEFHEQHLMVGESLGTVVSRVKKTEFYKTMGFTDAVSHIDDKHGVDIDDIFKVNDILPQEMKEHYSILLEPTSETAFENKTVIGYLKIDKLK